MHNTASRILTGIEQWRDNSSTDDTLNSLTLIQTFLKEIREMNFVILKEEEETATECPSILRQATDQEDHNCQKQTPDPTMVVRRDDITPTSSAKTRRKT